MSLYNITYVSSAVTPFSEAELLQLLTRSRANNEAVNVSGMLLYSDGNFMQALEGEEPAVRAVHLRIAQDRRHRGLITLLQGPIPARSFQGWSMGFRNLDVAPDVRETPGYSEFLNADWRGTEFRENPSRATKLLCVFREQIR